MVVRTTVAALLLFSLVAAAAPASGQAGCDGAGPPVEMRMLLEKTIFQIDVLTLTVRIRGPEGARLRRIRRGGSSGPAVRDTLARVAVRATCARARIDFLRDISLDRFLDAIRASSRAAMEAGLVDSATFGLIDRSLPEWYAFLEGRGVEEGDRMTYRIRGDTLGIRYRSADGRVLLDRTDVGAARRRSVLAGYFAPGSDFREGLIESLFERDGPPAGAGAGDAGPLPRGA